MTTNRTDGGFVSRIIEAFLHGNLSVLLILVMLACGAAALTLTPREEEPQIVVPMADIFVRMPGATAEEVEQQVSSKLERLLYQIDGVEYVYSMSRPGGVQGQIIGLSRELRKLGVDVRIVAPCDGPPPDPSIVSVGPTVEWESNGSVAPIAPGRQAARRTAEALRSL